MFCRECGKLINEGDKFCTGCGTKVEPISAINNVKNYEINQEIKPEKNVEVESKTEEKKEVNNDASNNNVSYSTSYVKENNDKPSVWFNILAFFIPIVGLILFVTMKNDTPKKAKSIGISALVGYILSMFVSIVLCIYIYGFVIPNMNKKYNNYPRYNRNYNFEIDRDFNI